MNSKYLQNLKSTKEQDVVYDNKTEQLFDYCFNLKIYIQKLRKLSLNTEQFKNNIDIIETDEKIKIIFPLWKGIRCPNFLVEIGKGIDYNYDNFTFTYNAGRGIYGAERVADIILEHLERELQKAVSVLLKNMDFNFVRDDEISLQNELEKLKQSIAINVLDYNKQKNSFYFTSD